MTNHPLDTLRNHIEQLAFICNTPALYAHHIELMFHYHALDCTETDSIYAWEVYGKADKARRKAARAVKRYVQSKKLFMQHQLERAG